MVLDISMRNSLVYINENTEFLEWLDKVFYPQVVKINPNIDERTYESHRLSVDQTISLFAAWYPAHFDEIKHKSTKKVPKQVEKVENVEEKVENVDPTEEILEKLDELEAESTEFDEIPTESDEKVDDKPKKGKKGSKKK